jgi:hypothetical protein
MLDLGTPIFCQILFMGKLYPLSVVLFLLLLDSCQKHPVEPSAPGAPVTKKDTLPRSLGLLPVSQELYQKFIHTDQLPAARTNVSCALVDLTAKFPIPDQQGIQGSCVSWTVGYYIKTYWEGVENGWDVRTPEHTFSPQYIFSQTHTTEEAGGGASFLYDALNILQQQGAATLDVCPYEPWNPYGFQTPPTDAMRQQAFRFRIASWSAVPMRDVNVLKDYLCQGVPIALGIPVFPDFDYLNYSNDTYNDFSGNLRGWHSVALIGYDDTRQAFKLINSWDQGWGLEGYGWISYDLIANYSLEAYVMVDQPNPPLAETWSSTSSAGVGTLGYYSGDVNGDGNSDVIQPRDYNGSLGIITHDITGATTTVLSDDIITGTNMGNANFVAADINGDGKTDLVRAWNSAGNLAFTNYTSNGTSFSRSWEGVTAGNYQSLKLLPVDVNADGRTDIAQIWNHYSSIGVNLYKSNGTSYTLASSLTMPAGISNLGFIPADYNGDGRTDIIQLWNNNGSLGLVIFRATGSGFTMDWTGTLPDSSANVGFAPIDYDGDGKMDFVKGWNNNNSLNLAVYRSNGSSYSFVTNIATPAGYQNLGLLPQRRAGFSRSGVLQVFNNNAKTAFSRYDPVEY